MFDLQTLRAFAQEQRLGGGVIDTIEFALETQGAIGAPVPVRQGIPLGLALQALELHLFRSR